MPARVAGHSWDPDLGRGVFPVVALACLLLAVSSGAFGQGGGQVTNVPPAIEGFERIGENATRVGQIDSLVGVVQDDNGEQDLRWIRIGTRSGPDVLIERELFPEDRNRTQPSDPDAEGWTVWNPEPGDGRLSFRLNHTYASSGSYVWELTVLDQQGPGPENRTLEAQIRGIGGGGGPGPTTGDGDGDGSEGSDGSDGTDGDEGDDGDEGSQDPPESLDLSESLTVTRTSAGPHLQWQPPDQAQGFQVWRSTSPWVLLATLPAGSSEYLDEEAPEGARYKVTFLLEGMEPLEDPEQVPGWSEEVFADPVTAEVTGTTDSPGSAVRWILPAFILLVIAVAVAWSTRRERTR